MLGIPLNSNSAEGVPTNDMHQQKVGFYWLDDWKATSRLTINYGVRWDWYGAVTDANGRIRNLSFANSDMRTDQRRDVSRSWCLIRCVSEALYDINWKQIMPRLGIVYRLNDRTVVRMGSGLFYSPQQTNNFNILGLNPPFSGSTVFQNDRNNPTATIQNPFAGSPVGGGPAAIVMLGWTARRTATTGRCISTTRSGNGRRRSNAASVRTSSPASPMSAAPDRISTCRCMNWNNPDPGLGAVQGRRPYQFYVDSTRSQHSASARHGPASRIVDQLELPRAATARGEALLAWTDLQRFLQLSESDVHRLWSE